MVFLVDFVLDSLCSKIGRPLFFLAPEGWSPGGSRIFSVSLKYVNMLESYCVIHAHFQKIYIAEMQLFNIGFIVN